MYPFWSLVPQSKDALDRYLVRDITHTQVFTFELHMGHLDLKDVYPQPELQQKVVFSYEKFCHLVSIKIWDIFNYNLGNFLTSL